LTTGDAFGVWAQANNARNNYAIYGQARSHIIGHDNYCPPPYGNGWAGFFNGATFCSSGIWNASDAQLKSDIEPLTNAGQILNQLNTKTYTFNNSIAPNLVLQGGEQFGFLAQDVQDVLPSLVTDVVLPAMYDENNDLVFEEFHFKAVNYEGIIPLLVAGFQEQQATIAAQQEAIAAQQTQIQELAALVAACCEAGGATPKSMNQPQGPQDEGMNYGL
jgi:hypothetical protein